MRLDLVVMPNLPWVGIEPKIFNTEFYTLAIAPNGLNQMDSVCFNIAIITKYNF